MLNLTATSLFDGTLATFLVVFTLLLILITKIILGKDLCKILTKVTKDSLNLLTTNAR